MVWLVSTRAVQVRASRKIVLERVLDEGDRRPDKLMTGDHVASAT